VSPSIDVLLLIALPASGKSEVRRFLNWLQQRYPHIFRMFGFGEHVAELDDYPYVEFMRMVDRVLRSLDLPPIFFFQPIEGEEQPFCDSREWGVLARLLKDDYDHITDSVPTLSSRDAIYDLFERLDRAANKVGIGVRFTAMSRVDRSRLVAGLLDLVESQDQGELRRDNAGKSLIRRPYHWRVKSLKNTTVIVECARGGPEGATMPLDGANGYQYTLPLLGSEILRRASVLNIKVTPDDSRRRNRERATPPPGCTDTTLFHGVSEAVMRRSYGVCDLAHMIESSGVANCLRVVCDGTDYLVPVGIFDNCGRGCTDAVREKRDNLDALTEAERDPLFFGLFRAFCLGIIPGVEAAKRAVA
jgi:hypothetical protein